MMGSQVLPGLTDSAPLVNIGPDSIPDNYEEEDDEVKDVKFVPEFEFHDDDDDDDEDDSEEGDLIGAVSKRQESVYGLAAFSSLMYENIGSRLLPKKIELDVELKPFHNTLAGQSSVVDESGFPGDTEREDELYTGREQLLDNYDCNAVSVASSGVTDYIDEILRLDKEAYQRGKVNTLTTTSSPPDMFGLRDSFSADKCSAEQAITSVSNDKLRAGETNLNVAEAAGLVEEPVSKGSYDEASDGVAAEVLKRRVADSLPSDTWQTSFVASAGIVVPNKASGVPVRQRRVVHIDDMLSGSNTPQSRLHLLADEPLELEQEAHWLVNPAEIVVREYHIPSTFKEKSDVPSREQKLRPRFLFSLDANIHFKLLAGFDWPTEELLLAKVIKAEDEVNLMESEFPGLTDNAEKTATVTMRPRVVDPVDKLNRKQRNLLSSLMSPEPMSPGHVDGPDLMKVENKIDSALFDNGTPKQTSAESKKAKRVIRRNVDVKRFTRDKEDCLGLHLKGFLVKLRVYDPVVNDLRTTQDEDGRFQTDEDASAERSSSRQRNIHLPIPDLRMSIGVTDAVVSLSAKGRRKRKVLGKLKENIVHGSVARTDSNQKLFVNISATGYDVSRSTTCESSIMFDRKHVVDMEYRVSVTIQPIRLFLNENVLEFVKALAECQECIDIVADRDHSKSNVNTSRRETTDQGEPPVTIMEAQVAPRVAFYIQCITVSAIDVVIDYEPSILNMDKLQEGDYLQFLNFFPLENMSLTLKSVKFTAVSSLGKFFASAGELWVRDIYETQIFRVLSGAAPLKALSNIGAGLQDLIVTPLAEFHRARKLSSEGNRTQSSSSRVGGTGGHNVSRVLRKTTMKLLQTVSRETLDASHKLTMLLARGIETLATGTEKTGNIANSGVAHTRRLGAGSAANNNVGGSSISRNTPLNRPLKHRNTSAVTGPQQLRKIGDEWEPQPTSVSEGLQRGFDSLSREIASAVDVVVTVPLRTYHRTGNKGQYVKEVITALPIALLRPIAGTAEAMSYTLLGLRNNIDPSARVGEEDVWEHSLADSAILRPESLGLRISPPGKSTSSVPKLKSDDRAAASAQGSSAVHRPANSRSVNLKQVSR
jgi:hypothetical protein